MSRRARAYSPARRDAALRRLRSVNRLLIGASLAATGLLSEVAAQAFPGHARVVARGVPAAAPAAGFTRRASTQVASTPPAASQAASSQPASSQPASTQPASTQPAPTPPAASQPTSTQPPSTQPSSTAAAAPPPVVSGGS